MVQERIYNYFERNPQLHVLFIFDEMGIVENDLLDAQWPTPYIYKVFDGAWLNTKYAIEHTWREQRVVLLFPGGSCPKKEEQLLRFPLLDVLMANMEYKEDDYDSFMQQHALPEKFRLFVKKNIGELMSGRVQSLLEGYLTAEAFSEDVACRAFVSAYLGEKRLADWDYIIAKMVALGAATEEKRRNDFFLRLAKNIDADKAVRNKLTAVFGVTYNPNTEDKMKAVAECLKYNSITQLLDASPSDNYKQYKVTGSLRLDAMNKVYECGLHSRQLQEKFAAAMTELAAGIREEEIIRTYGTDAQYYYLTETLCWPILRELMTRKLAEDPEAVNDRMRELATKFAADAAVQMTIRFTEQVALYYDKVRRVDTLKLNTPEDYVQRYTGDWYLLDTFYRHALEAYHELLVQESPIEETVQQVKQQLDRDYAKFANEVNLEWLTCAKERGDWFDSLSLGRQEDFYHNEGDATAKQVVIISDALRYEVAAELMQQLAKEKHVATLAAYRAMLPTETKYCKPALLPQNGTEVVRVRYEEVMNGDTATNRELFKHPLVYVYHDVIDENSHPQNPFEVIRSCRTAISQLSVLIKRLHASWNVANVVLTADHGFIYNDMKFEEKDKHRIAEDTLEKKTRYYLTRDARPAEGIVKMPLERVSNMRPDAPTYVAVPVGTNRLAAPGGYNFAHGGATLQEMLIPVVRSSQRRTNKTDRVGVALMNHNLVMVSSRLKFHLIQSEAVSMTVMERRVTCQVFAGDAPVTAAKVITLNSTDATNLNNRVFEVTLTLNRSVSSSVLQLRVYDVEDLLNPLIRETVKNNTMIEQDF